MGARSIEERLDWRRWVTPKPLQAKLVYSLIENWELGSKDLVLDPFAGAGTTPLAAKEKGLSATGYDLSPLAVLVAGAKITDYDVDELETAWGNLKEKIDPVRWECAVRPYLCSAKNLSSVDQVRGARMNK